MDDIKILVCCHKTCNIHKGDLYLPIQVGKAKNNSDLGIQPDNSVNNESCDNISELNHLYCETTAMYWAWKNIRPIYPNIKYIGLCHYRRYFSSEKETLRDKVRIVKNRAVSSVRTLMGMNDHTIVLDSNHKIKIKEVNRFNRSDESLRKIIEQSDIVSTRPVVIINSSVEDFFDTIGRDYIALMKNIVHEKYSEYYNSLTEVLNGSHLNAANMIILKTELLDEYCDFIFGVMDSHLKLVKENGLCDDPLNEGIYSRIPGYLAELLTCSYIRYKANKCKVSYVGKFFVEG